MRVRLLSGQVFSHFGELWLAVSHGWGITSGIYASMYWSHAATLGEHSELGAVARWAVGMGGALLKAVWWDLRLASLLTHLFYLCCFGALPWAYDSPLYVPRRLHTSYENSYEKLSLYVACEWFELQYTARLDTIYGVLV